MRAALLVLGSAWLLSSPGFAHADGSAAERLVKAAYLYHFCNLVSWPPGTFAEPAAPLRVGLLGNDELASELERLVNSRRHAGRPIQVVRLKRTPVSGPLHLLYLNESTNGQLAELLAPWKAQPVLTVTESQHGLAHGSVINFVEVDGALRFEVSQAAASRANLNISTRLMAVSWNFSATPPKFR